MVRNVHERLIRRPPGAGAGRVGELIDRLASRGDVTWPRDRWPAMRFDRPLGVGAAGGHGPIRYFVEAYEPGRAVRFRFTGPRGFDGTHAFEVEEGAAAAAGGGGATVRVRHTISMETRGAARLTWPLLFRPLHDALVEDALDCAEGHCTESPVARRSWGLRVRLLRRAAELLG